jgi:hypothetical protein
MDSRYQETITFKRKLSAIEHKLNKTGYQTEPNERECWLGVTRYKKQTEVAYFFIMEESIDRVITDIKRYLRYA